MIILLEQKGATAKARRLTFWMDGLFTTYEDRIIPIGSAVSALSGKLEAEAIVAGHSPGMADALIAGTAKAHDLTVVTLNLKHFEPFGIDIMTLPVGTPFPIPVAIAPDGSHPGLAGRHHGRGDRLRRLFRSESDTSSRIPASDVAFSAVWHCFPSSSLARNRAMIIGQVENFASLALSVRLRR